MVIWVAAILILFIQAEKEKVNQAKVESEKEKEGIYRATYSSAQHILNNLLNQLQYIKTKIEDSDIEDETQNIMDEIIDEGTELMSKLSQVEHINADEIRLSVKPSIKK